MLYFGTKFYFFSPKSYLEAKMAEKKPKKIIFGRIFEKKSHEYPNIWGREVKPDLSPLSGHRSTINIF